MMEQQLIFKEKPKQQQKQIKFSDIFRQAQKERIPQCKGVMTDHKGGFCAIGLLHHKLNGWDGIESSLKCRDDRGLIALANNMLDDGLMNLNDNLHWTWEDFVNAFERIENK